MRIHDVNPSIKALTVLLCVFLLALTFDPVTPLLFFLWTAGVTFVLGRVPVRKWLLYFLPFQSVGAGYVWTAVVFPNLPEGQTPHVLWTWGWLEISRESLERGISLGLRVFSFSALSFLFIFTTDSTRLMLSLMQQCKMPPKLAYSILAGYRFLPLFKEELLILRNAHRVRGMGRDSGLWGRVKLAGRYVIPLLASAIRKAERTAMAMESKGFTGSRNRSFYRKLTVGISDWAFVAFMLVPLLLSFYLSWKLGYLRAYKGEL